VAQRLGQLSFLAFLAALVVAGLVVPQGGTPTLTFKLTDSGTLPVLTGPKPKHVRGGLINVKLINSGRASHSAQLIRVVGKDSTHTTANALNLVASPHPKKIPVWLRFLGGLGPTPAGQSNVATINLTGGQYLVVDTSGARTSSPPAHTTITIDPGNPGNLPKTTAGVTGATGPKGSTDRYQWKLAGLKAGANRILFDSEGKKTIHQVLALRLKGSPSLGQLKKGLKSNSTPSFVDTSVPPVGTATLDGNNTHTETATLDLAAGTYVFFCPLTDRNDGKPHFLEGMLTTLTVH
jgi:hypothetical protein